MTYSETNRPSDTHSNHTDKRTAPNHLDLIRFISSQRSKETLSTHSSAQDKGKHPASQEESERVVGENGKPVEKLQLVPEREFLRGGMPRDDRASTSGRIRAEDLARMSPDEQVDWCMQGGLAEVLRPGGDRTFIPVIKNILCSRQTYPNIRLNILDSIGLLGQTAEFRHEIVQIANVDTQRFDTINYILKSIKLSGCMDQFKSEVITIVQKMIKIAKSENRIIINVLKH